MKNLEKYKSILLKNNLSVSDTQADLLIDALYQLAFTTVSKYLNERNT